MSQVAKLAATWQNDADRYHYDADGYECYLALQEALDEDIAWLREHHFVGAADYMGRRKEVKA